MSPLTTDNEIVMRAEAYIRCQDARRGSVRAEIRDPYVGGRWYALLIAPQAELRAARHLLKRAFGIYLPQFQRRYVKAATKVRPEAVKYRTFPLLPGYLFVYLWNFDLHWHRISATPGVKDVLGGEKPWLIPWSVIHKFQALEWNQSLEALEMQRTRRFRGRPRRKGKDYQRLMRDDYGDADDPVIIRCKSYLKNIEDLPLARRINAFHKAIGLSS